MTNPVPDLSTLRDPTDLTDLLKSQVPRDRIAALPEHVRGVLILAGHILNELHTMNILGYLTLKEHEELYMNRVGAGRAWVVIRIMAGKLVEAIKFLQNEVLRPPHRDDYLPFLHKEAQDALKIVRKQIGRKGILRIARDGHANHYPSLASIERGFNVMQPDEDWNFYTGATRHSVWSGFSDMVALRAMLADFGDSPEAGMRGLALEALDTSHNLIIVLETIFTGILLTYGLYTKPVKVMDLTPLPKLTEFVLPAIFR